MFFVLLAALLVPQSRNDREIRPKFLPEEFMLLACMFLSPIFLSLILMYRQGAFYEALCHNISGCDSCSPLDLSCLPFPAESGGCLGSLNRAFVLPSQESGLERASRTSRGECCDSGIG